MLAAKKNGVRSHDGSKDLEARFVAFAADYFGTLARGEKPRKPDPFVAEIAAAVCAETVGAEVPMPLANRWGGPNGSYKKKEKEPEEPPAGPIKKVPLAESWLRSHGFKTIYQSTVEVVSAFLGNPSVWWSMPDLALRLKRSRPSTTGICSKLMNAGILVKRGDRGKDVRWKLKGEPAHV